MSKLAGVTIARNAVKYDYCIKECIKSLQECCDFVIVAYVDSDDGTIDEINSVLDEKTKVLHLSEDDWNVFNDKRRLSYITNIAIEEADRLGFSYVLYVQADEVLHESSYLPIRFAMANNNPAYLVRRANLWKTPDFELNVPDERKPCSEYVVRLAKPCYRAYDDAESLLAPSVAEPDILIVHYGFVRKKEVMKSKIINMQEGVFSMCSHDPKLDEMDVFNPDAWFDPTKDLKRIDFTHPKVSAEWVKQRP